MKPWHISRRKFIQFSTLTSASTGLGIPYISAKSATPRINVLETSTISQQPEYYCGWPTLTRRSNGELIVVWSGGREAHVCPFGRVDMMRSMDNGKTWSWPRTLLDGPIDDRDAGIVETAKGSLLVTTFTSLAYEAHGLNQALSAKQDEPGAWSKEKLNRWLSVHNRISPEERKAELGQWMIRSTDGGITWSARYSSIVNSPHGPIQLSDGRLLYAGKVLWTGDGEVGVCESKDDGLSWQWLSSIPTRPGDDAKKSYHELHAVEAADGRIIVHIRNHNPINERETLQCESTDGGKSWSTPHSIGVWGLPSFLTKLRDGRLLMSYGYRRPPYGNQARISSDHGETWSEPMILSGDGAGFDLGYPSTIELEDATLLTIWYERLKGSNNAVLRQARWKLME
ncbi:MAG: exo-alpha-sialidase [Opitutales bacterium]|nr:exo-alpha-sialidase [Opitutales bacterium]